MQVTLLLSTYLEKYALRPVFTEQEVEHYLMPVEDVVDSYVVEAAGQPWCPPCLVMHCGQFLSIIHALAEVWLLKRVKAWQHDTSWRILASEQDLPYCMVCSPRKE